MNEKTKLASKCEYPFLESKPDSVNLVTKIRGVLGAHSWLICTSNQYHWAGYLKYTVIFTDFTRKIAVFIKWWRFYSIICQFRASGRDQLDGIVSMLSFMVVAELCGLMGETI